MSSDQDTADFMNEVLRMTHELTLDDFGHHVVDSLLEHGLSRHKSRIVTTLLQDLQFYAWNRNGAYVVEFALQHGDQEHREALAWDLLAWSHADLVRFATNRHKGSIMLALLEVSDEVAWTLKEWLGRPEAQQRLAAFKHCKKLRDRLGQDGASVAKGSRGLQPSTHPVGL